MSTLSKNLNIKFVNINNKTKSFATRSHHTNSYAHIIIKFKFKRVNPFVKTTDIVLISIQNDSLIIFCL